MPTMNPRFTITVTDEMMKEINDFRFENRYPTRNQAIVELFRVGLENIKKKKREENEKE